MISPVSVGWKIQVESWDPNDSVLRLLSMVSTTRNHSTVNSKESRPDGNRDGPHPHLAPLNESSKSIASFTPLARLNTPHQALTSDETWGLLFATAMLRRLTQNRSLHPALNQK